MNNIKSLMPHKLRKHFCDDKSKFRERFNDSVNERKYYDEVLEDVLAGYLDDELKYNRRVNAAREYLLLIASCMFVLLIIATAHKAYRTWFDDGIHIVQTVQSGKQKGLKDEPTAATHGSGQASERL